MAKRIYTETVKSWGKGIGISGVSLFGLIFMYLIAIGSISNVTYSGDMVCAGTPEDPCYAYINFTANEDIFIYPTNYDPWGRDTLFNFNPNVKSWRLERSWGTGWRNIPINTTCTGTWCGAKDNMGCAYSMAFRKDRDYQIRIVAYKNSPTDTLKWGAFSGVDEIDPFWYGVNETPTTLVSNNISVELGTALNFTTNISGATTTCVDIDHPEYGDNYTCGTPNANFTLNLSYFRETEFNDGETEKTMDSTYTYFNGTPHDGGYYGSAVPFETCSEYYLDGPMSNFQVEYNVWSWAQGTDYLGEELVPQITIRDSDRELLETLSDDDFGTGSGLELVVSEDVYGPGLYGFCLKMRYAKKPPQMNTTTISFSGQVDYTKYKTIDVSWNYDVEWVSSIISSNNAFGTNKFKHVYVYKNGTNVSVEYTGLAIFGATVYNSTNPNPSEDVDLVELWIQTGSGSAGFTETNTTSSFYAGVSGEENGGVVSFQNAKTTPYADWHYEVPAGSRYQKGPHLRTFIQNDSTFYISSHQYDEVQNISINLTGIEIAKDVKIYINGTLSNTLGFIYNTSSGNVSETESTIFNLLNGNSTTFRIPKGATVTNTTLNFTGSNSTWEVSEYSIPETWSSSYDASSPALPTGTQSWSPVASNAVDGSIYSLTGPWIDGPTLWNVEWMAYIYEDYTKDDDAMTANWSTSYTCDSDDDITFDVDCWSGSAWVEIISKTGTNCGSYQYETYPLPSSCVEQSTLKIKNSLQYGDIDNTVVQRAHYREGKVNYYRTGPPENMTIEVGIVDGAYEYEGTGELTGSDSTTDFVAEVNSYLDTCAADENDFCEVPIYFNSQDGGILTIDNIEVLYTYDPNPISISSSVVQNFLNSSTNDVNIPVYFSMDEGSFNVSDLRYDYKGGNDTISILAFEQGNTSNNETLNLFAYFSSFFKNLPYTWANKIFFIPKTNSSKNVTAYGQTTTIPVYNLTTTNYGGDINLSIKVDDSFSCLNLTWSNNATKNESNVINTTWQTINSNVEYLNNTQIWLWADFDNCNASDQRILQPNLQIEGYCVDCEWF